MTQQPTTGVSIVDAKLAIVKLAQMKACTDHLDLFGALDKEDHSGP
jgi:hypothetical protein